MALRYVRADAPGALSTQLQPPETKSRSRISARADCSGHNLYTFDADPAYYCHRPSLAKSHPPKHLARMLNTAEVF